MAFGTQQLAGMGAADVTTEAPVGKPRSVRPLDSNGPGTLTLAQPVSRPANLTMDAPALMGVIALLFAEAVVFTAGWVKFTPGRLAEWHIEKLCTCIDCPAFGSDWHGAVATLKELLAQAGTGANGDT
eukprot:5644401-Amphidinium_carterae.1